MTRALKPIRWLVAFAVPLGIAAIVLFCALLYTIHSVNRRGYTEVMGDWWTQILGQRL